MLVGVNLLVETGPIGDLVKHGNLLKLRCNSTQVPDLDPEEMIGELERRWERKKTRNKRQIEAHQLIQLPKRTQDENLMRGLIKEFANLQNVSQITACLLIPRAVGQSIPWGIRTMNLTKIEKNETTHCEPKPVVEWQEQITTIRKQWKFMCYQDDCEKLLNHVFTRTQSSFFSFGTTNMGYCCYDEQRKM